MKNIHFKLCGSIKVDDNITAEQVRKAILFNLGLLKTKNANDIPDIGFLVYVSKHTRYNAVEIID